MSEESVSPARPARWRSVAATVCIVIAAILVPVSIVASWARVQLVDEDSFVHTLGPLVAEPAVQELIVDETMEAITAKVDFEQITADLFTGIKNLGVDPQAAAALDVLQGPTADGLIAMIDSSLTSVVASDRFGQMWTVVLQAGHRAVSTAATSDGGGVVVLVDDHVGLRLEPLVAQLKDYLVVQGIGIAGLIPEVDRVVILGSGEMLSLLRLGYGLAVTVGWWLPIVTVGLFALGIAIASRRPRALLGTGIGAALGGIVLLVALAIGVGTVTSNAPGLSPEALEVIFDRVVAGMRVTAVITIAVAAVVAAVGWATGISAGATRLRASLPRGRASSASSPVG